MSDIRTCSICLEACPQRFGLTCRHVYHVQCLAIWATNAPTCPDCGTTLPAETAKTLIEFCQWRRHVAGEYE